MIGCLISALVGAALMRLWMAREPKPVLGGLLVGAYAQGLLDRTKHAGQLNGLQALEAANEWYESFGAYYP